MMVLGLFHTSQPFISPPHLQSDPDHHSVEMASSFSLSSLSSELVGAIADLLPSQAITNLLNTGNGALRYRIRKGAANLELEVGPLENFPSWAFSFPRLRSLRVLSVHRKYSSPVSPLTLDLLPHEPHTLLHTLDFCFLPAMLVLRPHSGDRTIANMCPNLTKLKVVVGHDFQSAWLRNLPSTLSNLHLTSTPPNGFTPGFFGPEDIGELPKSLTELTLSHKWVLVKPDTIWPQNLSKLVCATADIMKLLPSIPKTLVHLSCDAGQRVDNIPFSLLPPGLVFFELQNTYASFILDTPLPPRMRTFLAINPKFFIPGGVTFTSDHLDEMELNNKFPYFFPRTLERFTPPAVPLQLLARHCPELEDLHRSYALFRTFPHWSYKGASLVLRQLDDPENPKWSERYLSRLKKATLAGRSLKPVQEPEAVNKFRFAKFKTMESPFFVLQGQAHLIFGGLINPKTFQEYIGPMRRKYPNLIISAGVALKKLIVTDRVRYDDSWSCRFVEHLGKSLVELECDSDLLPLFESPEFQKRQPMRTFNSNFEKLTMFIHSVQTLESSKTVWSTMPFPPSSTFISLSCLGDQSNLQLHCATTEADWSGFTRLETLHFSQDLRGYAGWSSGDAISPSVVDEGEFEEPGVTFKFIATLPPSITDLRCFLPLQLSVEGVRALPRNLITAHFDFYKHQVDDSWTTEHWEAFPKKIVSLTVLGAAFGKIVSAFGSRLLCTPQTSLLHLSNGRAFALQRRYESLAFWK